MQVRHRDTAAGIGAGGRARLQVSWRERVRGGDQKIDSQVPGMARGGGGGVPGRFAGPPFPFPQRGPHPVRAGQGY